VNEQLPLKKELQRKAIHLAANFIPLYYHFSHQKEIVQIGLAVLSAGFLAVDVLRMKNSLVRRWFLHIFGVLLREKESKRHLTGATMLFLGMLLTVFLFDEKQAVPALLFVGLADPAAAIVGRLWGKNRFLEKSLEGSAAFYLTASFVILAFTHYSWGGLVVALIVTVVELIPLGIDDNLLIPVLTGYLLSVVG
jgi:dolichol kinase